MKPFPFSLQSLREFREQNQQTMRARYARMLRVCEETAAQVHAVSAELARSWKTLCDQMAAGVTGDELLRARAWCLVLEIRVKERAVALEQARHAVDEVWKELLVVTRARETLELFFEKRPETQENPVRLQDRTIPGEVVIPEAHFPMPLSNPANPS